MDDKEFKELLFTMLKSMDSTLKEIEESTRQGVQVYLSDNTSESVLIPESIYDEICEMIGSDRIEFMGIS